MFDQEETDSDAPECTSPDYYLPFFMQTDPTEKLHFTDQINSTFEKHMGIREFVAPRPEDDFMGFATSVQQFLDLYQIKGVGCTQYRDLIKPFFTKQVWDDIWYKTLKNKDGPTAGCQRTLFYFAQKYYSLEQRARDYARIRAHPYMSFNWDLFEFHRDLYKQTPAGMLMCRLLEVQEEVRKKITERYYEDFSQYGLLKKPSKMEMPRARMIAKDVGVFEREALIARRRNQGGEPASKRRKMSDNQHGETDIRTFIPERLRNKGKKDWYEGDGKTESLKGWTFIPKKPIRKRQSFYYKPEEDIATPTKGELLHRERNHICDKCGNHEKGKGECIFHPFQQ